MTSPYQKQADEFVEKVMGAITGGPLAFSRELLRGAYVQIFLAGAEVAGKRERELLAVVEPDWAAALYFFLAQNFARPDEVRGDVFPPSVQEHTNALCKFMTARHNALALAQGQSS